MARRRFLADDSGASLVEAALVFPMFLALLIGILEIGVFGMTVASFDNALVAASRKIRTGQAGGPTDAASFMQAVCSNMLSVDCMNRLTVVVQSGASATQVTSAGAPQQGQSWQPGGANSYVLVTATYAWPLVVPFLGLAYPQTQNGQVLITNKLLFKNEPYS